MFSGTLHNCFDSHLHWQATGDWSHRLRLDGLQKPEDVELLKVESAHFRGGWLTGFGWDQNLWPMREFPHRSVLDRIFPDFPVAFSRADGHASWVNTRALTEIGFLTQEGRACPERYQVKGGKVLLDKDGLPTGVLIDTAKAFVDEKIPGASAPEMRAHLLEGMRLFHLKGITHIRDMSCDPLQWEQAVQLDQAGLLQLCVLQTFSAEDPKDFSKALSLAKQARKYSSPRLKPHSVKIYYDGALGSEGALLSQDYGSGRGRGFRLLEPSDFAEVLKETWSENWPLSIHVIGDQAVDEVVDVANTLWNQGFVGELHLEHAEVIRDDTLAKMKGRNVVCHLQPSHWLSDRKWAKEQLGSLVTHIFPWRKLEQLEVPFYFGSDSPIEPVGLEHTLRALKVAESDGIMPLKGDPLVRHQWRTEESDPNTYTVFEDGEVKELVFEGRHLL